MASGSGPSVVDVDPLGAHAEGRQRLTLNGEVLLVGGHAGIADQRRRYEVPPQARAGTRAVAVPSSPHDRRTGAGVVGPPLVEGRRGRSARRRPQARCRGACWFQDRELADNVCEENNHAACELRRGGDMRTRISRRIVGGLVVTVAALIPPTAAAQVATAAPCSSDAGPDAVCGTVAVPLDRADRSRGTIAIAYELHRRTDRSKPSLGTIVTSIGGPGGSNIAGRELWLQQFGALLDRRDLLLVDHRGIGRSEAINCPGLQHVRG